MSTFAVIIQAVRFKRITYYTVKLDGQTVPLYSHFVQRHTPEEFKDDMDLIRSWMRMMGERVGASIDYFRPERAAQAIPPPVKITKKGCQLRLYCLRLSHRVVVLFDGGQKTAKRAQDCPVVGPHFELANRLSEAIWKAIEEGNLRFDENDDLVIPPTFKISL